MAAKNRQSIRQQPAASAGSSWIDDILAREAKRSGGAPALNREKACLSKNRYACREDAEEAARTSLHSGRRRLRVYQCDYCDGWHLTSKEESWN